MIPESLTLSPADLIQVVFAVVAAFGAVLVWPLRRYRTLGAFLVFESALMALNLYENHSTGFLITPIFTLTKGPLLYLFIRAMVNAAKLPVWAVCAHLAPALVPLLIAMDASLVIAAGSVSQLVYLFLSFRLLRRYHRAARNFRSDAESLRLNWLVAAYGMFAAQGVISVIRLNLQDILSDSMPRVWYLFDVTFLMGLCCFLVFKALGRPPVYDQMLAYEEAGRRAPSGDTARDAGAGGVFACLEAVIAEKQLYRKPRFSVEDLAKETGLQMKDVSWAFNSGAGISFNEYINRQRVEALKRRLQASGGGTGSLLEMAFETGFNSKSSFNAAFKREVGMTPSQFIKTLSARKPGGGLTDAGFAQ